MHGLPPKLQSIILNFRKFFLVEGSQKSWRENLDWSAKFLKTMIWVFGIMYLHHHPKCVWVVAWLPLETKIFKNISSFQVSFDWFFFAKNFNFSLHGKQCSLLFSVLSKWTFFQVYAHCETYHSTLAATTLFIIEHIIIVFRFWSIILWQLTGP